MQSSQSTHVDPNNSLFLADIDKRIVYSESKQFMEVNSYFSWIIRIQFISPSKMISIFIHVIIHKYSQLLPCSLLVSCVCSFPSPKHTHRFLHEGYRRVHRQTRWDHNHSERIYHRHHLCLSQRLQLPVYQYECSSRLYLAPHLERKVDPESKDDLSDLIILNVHFITYISILQVA